MLKHIIEIFAGIRFTIASTVFLLMSLYGLITDSKILYNFAFITIFISGLPIVYKAYSKLIYNKKITSSLLITIAMVSAIIIGEIFAAAEVVFIMAVGEILEDVTIDKTKKGLNRLLSLTPTQGRKLFDDGHEEILSLENIRVNDVLRVKAGETIPVDGTVICGSACVNQATLTGEYLPCDKTTGDVVMAGTINSIGCIDIIVKSIKDTYLKRMIDLVKQAQNKKAPIEKTIDKLSSILIPLALVISLLTYIFTGEIIRAVTILVVFCPCAMILATPTAVMAAIGRATKEGILIKSGGALEIMGKIDTIVFDKTGTLTKGNLTVSDIVSFDKNIIDDDILAICASIELFSEHSLGKAVVACAKNRKIKLKKVTCFQMIIGQGVLGKIEKQTFLAGNTKFLEKYNIEIAEKNKAIIKKLQNEGKALIIISNDEKAIGVIALSDELREESKNVIIKLCEFGITSYILTGDNKNTTHYLAQQVGINKFYAELLPEDKVSHITHLQNDHHIVAMIGDGINDSPALKTANIGIAMGGIGSDISIDTADITLINDRLENIVLLTKLSKRTLKTIMQNISISLILNLIGITLSIVGILNPVSGAIMHNIGSIIVILVSAHIYRAKRI